MKNHKLIEIGNSYHEKFTISITGGSNLKCDCCEEPIYHKTAIEHDSPDRTKDLGVCFICYDQLITYWSKKKPKKIPPTGKPFYGLFDMSNNNNHIIFGDNTMKKTTIITGPQGSGKSKKAMEIIGDRLSIQTNSRDFYNDVNRRTLLSYPTVVIVNEVPSIEQIKVFVDMQNIGGAIKCPDLILLTNIDVRKVQFLGKDVEIIHLFNDRDEIAQHDTHYPLTPKDCIMKENWLRFEQISSQDFCVRDSNYDNVCEGLTKERANLIAAAPDMLEALKSARAIFQAQGINEVDRIGGEQYQLVCAAIDKAEGKEVEKPSVIKYIEDFANGPEVHELNCKFHLLVNSKAEKEIEDYVRKTGYINGYIFDKELNFGMASFSIIVFDQIDDSWILPKKKKEEASDFAQAIKQEFPGATAEMNETKWKEVEEEKSPMQKMDDLHKRVHEKLNNAQAEYEKNQKEKEEDFQALQRGDLSVSEYCIREVKRRNQ